MKYFPRHGRATGPRRSVERVRMALVVLPLVDSANAGHCEKEVSLRQVQDAVLAGAEPHCRRRDLVEDRLELGGTDNCTEDAADRTLLLLQSLILAGKLVEIVNLCSAHGADSTACDASGPTSQ